MKESLTYSAVDFSRSLEARFIGSNVDPDERYAPRILSNTESRVYQGGLHAKGYFFDKDAISTIIIGSSNLTQTVLTCSKEWNVLFHTFLQGEMLHQTKSEFEKLWDDRNTVPITKSWIASYERFRRILGVVDHPSDAPGENSCAVRSASRESMQAAMNTPLQS